MSLPEHLRSMLCAPCREELALDPDERHRGVCGACLILIAEYLNEQDRGRPPKDRHEVEARLAKWGLNPGSVTLCWHIAPGEDWGERWAGYRVEWVGMTRVRGLEFCTELERCENSGEWRQIIRWRLWNMDSPGFVEFFLDQVGSSWQWRPSVRDFDRDHPDEGHLLAL